MILQDESKSRFNKKQAIALWSFEVRSLFLTNRRGAENTEEGEGNRILVSEWRSLFC
ncbi:MAG: hypothetical protein KME52_02535 [Desmonostoc geniculatum HA4340-LM1]|nr:hypothetical protein [Desmonostoc geniculatum HA4340-LM1]